MENCMWKLYWVDGFMVKHQSGPHHQMWHRWKLLISFVHRCYLQSLLQISEMAWEEFEKSEFIIFSQSLVAHGEVVTWVSCHSDRPMLRYATLCVLSKMYRKLLFNNLSIFWNIKILLTNFCRESPQMLYEKVGLRNFANLQKKNGGWKWAWPISRHSAQFSERVDTRFLNVRQSICEL